MSFTEFYEQNKDTFDKVNNAILESIFSPVKEIYIDLAVIKDLRLGLMLSLSDDEQKKYLIDNIKSYNKKPNRGFTLAYPNFKYKEEELEAMYLDDKYHEQMFNFSPDTNLSDSLPGLIDGAIIQNDRSQYREKVVLHINTYPIEKSVNLDVYKYAVTRYLNGISTVDFFCKDPTKIDETFWTKQSIIIFDDIARMTKPDTGLFKPLFTDQSMLATKIAAPYSADKDKIAEIIKVKDYQDNLKDLFTITETYMKMMCVFMFLPCIITK
jgi:hypothetical protein